jgi:hypothetical protein
MIGIATVRTTTVHSTWVQDTRSSTSSLCHSPRRGMDDLQNQSLSNIPIWIKHGVDTNFICAAASFLPPDKLVFGPLVSSRSCDQFRSLAEENVAMWNSADTSTICDHPRRNNKFMGAASSCRNNPCFAHRCGVTDSSRVSFISCAQTYRPSLSVSIYIRQRPSTPELLLPPVILTAYSPFQVYNACSVVPSHFLTDHDDSSSL